jgi:hypothetical protein
MNRSIYGYVSAIYADQKKLLVSPNGQLESNELVSLEDIDTCTHSPTDGKPTRFKIRVKEGRESVWPWNEWIDQVELNRKRAEHATHYGMSTAKLASIHSGVSARDVFNKHHTLFPVGRTFTSRDIISMIDNRVLERFEGEAILREFPFSFTMKSAKPAEPTLEEILADKQSPADADA